MRVILAPLLTDLFLRLAGAACGAVVAVGVGIYLASLRGSSGVLPVEAALIALIITMLKDVFVVAGEAVQKARDVRDFVTMLQRMLENSRFAQACGEAIPFDLLEQVQLAPGVRTRLQQGDVRAAFLAVHATASTIRAKKSDCYNTLYPPDASQLATKVEDLLRSLGMKP